MNTKLTSVGPSTGQQLLLILYYHCIELPTITTVPNVLHSLWTPTQFSPPVFTANYLTIYFTVRLFNINTLNYKLNNNLFKSLCAINAVPSSYLFFYFYLVRVFSPVPFGVRHVHVNCFGQWNVNESLPEGSLESVGDVTHFIFLGHSSWHSSRFWLFYHAES